MSSTRSARATRSLCALQFYEEVQREIAAVPGVAAVAWTSQLPLTAEETRDVSFEIVGQPAVDERRRPAADHHIVSRDYFAAIDLPIVAGRGFTERDAANSPPVCLVNEALVRGTCPCGRRSGSASRCCPPREGRTTGCEIFRRRAQCAAAPTKAGVRHVYRPIAQRPPDDSTRVAPNRQPRR